MPNRIPDDDAPWRWMIPPLFLAALLLSPVSACAEGFYVRAALGVDWTRETRFRDVDPTRDAVAALYGAGTGTDGKPTQTVGDFGGGAGFSLGLGRVLSPALRLEAALSYRPKLAFEGDANYRRTPGRQSVTADLSTTSAILTAWLDLPQIGGLRPFIGLGGSLSYARIGRTLLRFPGLSQTTTVPGGRSQTVHRVAHPRRRLALHGFGRRGNRPGGHPRPAPGPRSLDPHRRNARAPHRPRRMDFPALRLPGRGITLHTGWRGMSRSRSLPPGLHPSRGGSHFPAFAVALFGVRARMMAKPGVSIEKNEFL